jgi:O-succinylbenzoic acid--CoA ligase
VTLEGPTPAVVERLRAWWTADEPGPILVQTSGSTGVPKRVLLSRRAVAASVEASARRVGTGRWVLALPVAHVAGVQVVCRSLAAGHEPVPAEAYDGLAAAVVAAGPDACVSLVPTQLHRALEDADARAALAGCRVVLLGGGPVDPALRARAEAAAIPVVATYGSSETAGGCVYDGHPLDGVGVVLGADGRIRIGGPTVFDGYLDDPGLTAAALVDGWFLTADAGRLDEDGRLHVLGRLDDVVVSGGVKVPLPAVAASLRTHPAVGGAEAVGLPDEEWGTRVVAAVVPTGATPTLGDLRDHVAADHPRSWAPRDLVLLDRLPLLANGKVDRRALEQRVRAERGAPGA